MVVNTSFHYLSLIVLISALIGTGDGLRCWVCSSDKDYNCGDPFKYNHFPLIDCERQAAHSTNWQGFPVCRKVVTRVNGQLMVERDCAWEQTYDNGRACSVARNSPYGIVEQCTTCIGDACNGAYSMIPSTWVSILMTAVSYFAVKYM